MSPAIPPPARTLTVPADVADAEALREYLADTDIFGSATAERDGYVSDALDRFRMTMALIPELPHGARVLELGANPYFLTRLLRRRGLDVFCANYFGPASGVGKRGVHTVIAPRSGERHVFEFAHFNVETESFPYDDGTFDLVLCCEILEHLPADPIHMLAECHRVLRKPNGTLLLTTPNATRLDNLILMLQGNNVYEQLSGYGSYGRHNREYTVAELQRLLLECGYEPIDVFAADIHVHPGSLPALGPDAVLSDRADNLFAIATAVGEPCWPYPDWLYSSQHALRRVVRPDMIVGVNDALQSSGLHPLEPLGGRPGRWMGSQDAVITLAAGSSGRGRLRIEGLAAPSDAADTPITLAVSFNGTNLGLEIPCDGRDFTLEAPIELIAGPCDVRLTADPTWRPCDRGIGDDARSLGIALRRVAIEPLAAET